MVTLRDAVVAAQTNLRVARKNALAEHGLVGPLGYLSGVLSCLPDFPDEAATQAKRACEDMIDCAHVAEDFGDADLAEDLRRISSALSPVVAAQL